MPKLSYKITEFHGGTNSNADPRDLADNEQPYTRDVDVSKYGLIKIIPEAYPGAAKEKLTNAWSSGVNNYGLHFFGADNRPTDNADGNFTLTALYDGQYVDIYAGGSFDDWNRGDYTFTDATCDYNNDPTITHDANPWIVAGLSVSGTGIPTDPVPTISSITSTTEFELSANTTGGSVTNGTLTFTGVEGDRRWASNEIDFTGGSGSSQPLFYNADGVLRVYDRALENAPKWYGHIEAERFAGITNINSGEDGTGLDDWVSTTAAPASPTTGYAVMSTPQSGSEATGTNPDYDDQNGGLNSSAQEYIGVVSAEFCATNSVNLRVGVQMTEITYQTASDINTGTTGTPSDVHEIIPFIGTTANTPNTCAKVYPGASAQQTISAGASFDLTIDESTSLVFPIYIDTAVKGNITSMNFRVGDDASNYYRWNFSGSEFKSNVWNIVVLSKDKNTATTGTPSDWGDSFEYFLAEGNSSAADTDEPSWYQCGIATVPVSEELTGYPEGEHTFHYTWLYDDSKQESLPFEFAEPDTNHALNNSSKINILGDSVLLQFQAYITIGALDTYGIDKRITGARLYDKVDTDDNYYLIGEIDFIKKGFMFFPDSDTVDYSIVNCNDTSSAPLTYTGVIKGIKPVEANIIDTFKTINGYSTTTNSVSAEYKTAVTQGRRAYVGNIKQDADGDGSAEFYEDRMLRSQVNKFDTFPSELGVVDVAIRDGESIVKLESFNDRILQFKERTLYVINVSDAVEFLEDTFQFRGIGFPYHAVKTDIGVAFFNKFGCFIYDGKSIVDLLERQRRKTFDQEDFEDFIDGDSDTDYSETHIAYLPEQKQLFLLNNHDDVLLYDFTYMSWITRGVDRVNDANSKRSNLQLDWKDRLCYVIGNNAEIEYWQESGDSKYLDYRTKDFDFGEPGSKKLIYKVIISYKGGSEDILAKFAVNGTQSFSGTFDVDGTTTTKPLPYSSNWTTAVLKPTSGANNIYSFQLQLVNDTVVSGDVNSFPSSTTFTIDSADNQVDDFYQDKIVRIVDGPGVGESRKCTDYVNSTRVLSVLPSWTATLTTDSDYEIGWVDSDFAINDITIFYRLKPPGAGA